MKTAQCSAAAARWKMSRVYAATRSGRRYREMAENINNLTSAEIGAQVEKIKTHFAQIVVGGSRRKPYYHILFFNPADGEFHVGWSSYKLKYVRRWLRENFEIVDGASVYDMSPVKRGRWVKVGVGITERVVCSACGSSKGSYTKPLFCNQCGAKMTKENENHG